MLKKNIFIFSLFWFFSLCIFNAFGTHTAFRNNYYFKQVSYEQGLPGTNLRDQIQDKDGIMWICIESIGLCKYDGHKFTLYNHNPDNPESISSSFVNMVAEDHNNDLWIATDYGLNMFDKNKHKFKAYFNNTDDSLTIPNNICKSVYVDSKGNLWVGTDNGFAIKKKGSNYFRQYLAYNINNTNQHQYSVLCILEQDENTFWLGTNNGLIKFNPNNGVFKKWSYDGINKNTPCDNLILDIIHDKDGHLWLGTHKGLDRFDIKNETFKHYNLKDDQINNLLNEGISVLLIDKFDKLWIGTHSNGIIIIDPKTDEFQTINKEDIGNSTLKSNHIRYFYKDNLGLIWIGTKFEGIFKYNNNSNVLNNCPENLKSLLPLSNIYLYSFLEDIDDHYWLGSKYKGLYKVNSKTGEIINFQHQQNELSSLSSNRIQYIFRDSQNKLWIGTNVGLNLMNEEQGTFTRLTDMPVNWICEDQIGIIWVGTPKGLFVVDRLHNKVKQYNSNKQFFRSDNYDIMQIYCDSEGTIWYTTRYDGLFSYSHQDDSLKHLQYHEDSNIGIGGNMTRAILEDSRKRLWVSSKSQGLSLLNRKTGEYIKYTKRDGLPSNMVISLEEDLNGNIWMGTHSGIAKFNPDSKTVFNYNSDYGLKSNVLEIGASHSFKTGELLFGGNNGFNVFNPDEIEQNKEVAPLFISSIKIDDVEYDKTALKSNTIVLNHKQKFISFEFCLTDYNSPIRHQYAVMMEGIDDKYRHLGNRNYISYSNLESGKYTFKLKGANEFGIWSKEPTVLNVFVKKPFYKLLWFKIIASIMLLAFIGMIISQMRKRQNTLERLINERTKKLEIAYKELLNKNTKIREQNRQIELQQANLEQKVAERTHDLEIAKSKAEESDRLKSSFLANISHEIRTPLNAITGFSALICGDIYSPERKQKYINIIKANTTSLLKLVEDLLDISRIEAEQLTIEKEMFDFENMINELNVIFQEEIRIKHDEKVKLYCEKDDHTGSSLMFYSDQIRIRQILINLLNNAIKFTNVGDIRFGYKLEEDNILFWVKDTGIGIKKKDIDSIFNRFIKIENDNAMYRGTGLGLSISKSLVNLLGGEIWVKSLENIGSSFYFNIPGKIQNNHIIKTKTQAPLTIDLNDKKIIIVEFDRSNYILLNSYFIGTNANIVWANCNKTAVEYCSKEKFDLMILDFRVNDIESNKVFSRIKEIHPELPIIAQTSYANEEDEIKLQSIGFNDYIIKPFLKKDLLEKIIPLI